MQPGQTDAVDPFVAREANGCEAEGFLRQSVFISMNRNEESSLGGPASLVMVAKVSSPAISSSSPGRDGYRDCSLRPSLGGCSFTVQAQQDCALTCRTAGPPGLLLRRAATGPPKILLMPQDLSSFFQDLKLDSEEKKRAIAVLEHEGVTFEQLKSEITDEDLKELEFASETRDAILERARILSSATVFHMYIFIRIVKIFVFGKLKYL